MEAELLAEILARPDEDEPRLVYADWLVERGDPRGELIHVQCRTGGFTTRRTGRWANMTESELGALEQRLLKKHEKAWIGPLYGRVRPLWRRGFIDYVLLNGVQLVELMEPLFSCAPLAHFDIRKVTWGHCDAMAVAPAMRGVRRLSLTMPTVTPRALRLLASPNLVGLQRLRVDLMYGNAGIEILRDATGLSSLEHLELSNMFGYVSNGRRVYHALAKEQLDAITSGPAFARLRSLAFDCHNQGLAECMPEMLARGTSLRVLSVQQCGLPDAHVAALLSAPGLSLLEEVHLAGNEIGQKTMALLGGDRPPPSLKRIDLLRLSEPVPPSIATRYEAAKPFMFRM